jgi:DNA-directed RNA polymerase II subunit RPB1
LKDTIGPVAKATFEMHTEMFLNAARHGQLDNMRGVSSNVMTGQFGYFGTGAFNLLLDLQSMEKNNDKPQTVSIVDYDKNVESSFLKKKAATKNNACSLEAVEIDNKLSNTVVVKSVCQLDEYDMGF